MYFKINSNTQLAKEVIDVLNRVDAVKKETFQKIKDWFQLENPGYQGDRYFLAGRVLGIYFHNHPGKEWSRVKNVYDGVAYRPKASILKQKAHPLTIKWNELQCPIKLEELLNLLGLRTAIIGLTCYYVPAILELDGNIYLSIADEWAKESLNKPEDMTEIMASEYINARELKTEQNKLTTQS